MLLTYFHAVDQLLILLVDNGELSLYISANMDVLTKVQVTYETFPGWSCSTEGVRSFDELPSQAQAYIRFIEDFLQVPGKNAQP